MRLTAAKGNMYPFCDYTANPLAGECPHDCVYCYMKDLNNFSQVKKKYTGEQRVWRKDLNKPTGGHVVRRRENVPYVPDDIPIIFVCSGNDLGLAPTEVKIKILRNCCDYPSYCYLLQSKNPIGLKKVEDYFPPNVILGTTIETDKAYLCGKVSNAPPPERRIDGLNYFDGDYIKMVSVEPIMECEPRVVFDYKEDWREFYAGGS